MGFKCKKYPEMTYSKKDCNDFEHNVYIPEDKFENTKISNCGGGGSERYLDYNDYIRIQYHRSLKKERKCENCIYRF